MTSVTLAIGSAREVASRRLAVFEHKGLVLSQRGHIDIVDAEKLREILES